MAHERIRWSTQAADDLDSICRFISKDSIHYAALFANRIMGIVENIPDYPMSGRVVPEYEDEYIREKIYNNYRIIYRLNNDKVEIAAICHCAKPLKEIT